MRLAYLLCWCGFQDAAALKVAFALPNFVCESAQCSFPAAACRVSGTVF